MKHLRDRYNIHHSAIRLLKRCQKCILPETFPFISFDEGGICNYCRDYKETKLNSVENLRQIVDAYRRKNGQPDCVVGISGGRDSSFGLHYIKKVLNMNPVAFTYDWGMSTDLAVRNMSRLCEKLDVRLVRVEADINKKRKHIQKNIISWLNRPELGLVPLFMAGDKAYFYHAKRLRNEVGAGVNFFCENMLERTDFKSGFAGVPPYYDENHVYTQSLTNKLKITLYYLSQYFLNPAYINSSIPDTLFAYASYYFISRDYYNLFKYIPWNEEEIITTLRNDYDWEVAEDTPSTWRIGDGTASFYNYIYYTLAGFTENDTFRSNQIREGMISRDKALELVDRENEPRWESMKWYCNTIGIDFDRTIHTINEARRLYPLDKL